ncbi:MAG: RagB/SusD family nutrient uptake outer membrane protein, partial [Muribaculaceae bacterium]|nr:RagB/SusD family nutrient uptake outer membrane protein [Muribaculaceae bacterium]
RLVQCYAPNWENANGGDVKCLIIRNTGTTEDKAFGTMGEALELIYDDLQTAIKLFDDCGWKRDFIWEPDGSVARGLLARAAMIKHDYTLAQQMAKEARQGYRIMSADEYNSGFVTANDEYMWATMYEAPAQSIYYYATGASNACNGRYQESWGYTVNSIDYMLYKKFPMSDVRKGLYITPEFIELNQELADEYGVTKDDFWDESKIYTNGFRIQINSVNDNMKNFVIAYGKQEYARQDAINQFLSGTVAPYQSKSSEILFGTQYKFWGNQIYGMNQWPFMRASEMGYTEAEAAFRNGDEATARKIMEELNKDVRDPNYTCSATGDALLQEIKDYRAFELWGEGFNWFDMKRWHDPIVRVAWEANNPNSGNRGTSFAQTFSPDQYYGWMVVVPQVEFNYNKLASRADLPGGNK